CAVPIRPGAWGSPGTWLQVEEILNTAPQEGLPKRNSPKPPRISWRKRRTQVPLEGDAYHPATRPWQGIDGSPFISSITGNYRGMGEGRAKEKGTGEGAAERAPAADAGHTDKSEAGLPKGRTRLPSWATQFTVEYQFPPSSPLQDSTQELQLRPAGRGDPLRRVPGRRSEVRRPAPEKPSARDLKALCQKFVLEGVARGEETRSSPLGGLGLGGREQSPRRGQTPQLFCALNPQVVAEPAEEAGARCPEGLWPLPPQVSPRVTYTRVSPRQAEDVSFLYHPCAHPWLKLQLAFLAHICVAQPLLAPDSSLTQDRLPPFIAPGTGSMGGGTGDGMGRASLGCPLAEEEEAAEAKEGESMFFWALSLGASTGQREAVPERVRAGPGFGLYAAELEAPRRRGGI
ncbi:hypothetical protein E2I00_004408, partial [Balaenoptera physalus]